MATLRITAVQDGVPAFNSIQLNHDDLARILSPYINEGFSRNRLTPDDIAVDIRLLPEDPVPSTVSGLIQAGMPIFDAIAYLSLPVHRRPNVVRVSDLANTRTDSFMQVAEGVSYLYFFLMTRANIPSGGTGNSNADVPSFLRVFMGYNLSRDAYMQRIASFPLTSIEHTWIRHITVSSLPQTIRSRLSLGIGGYRLFAPFRSYPIRADASPQAINAYNVVRAYLAQGVSWDIHPITRDMNLLSRAGPLNANLSNLILECFSTEEIAQMVQHRMLFQAPVRNPVASNWRTWDAATFGVISNVIDI